MANIIDNKKIRKIAHRFDTAENWKKSNVQLLPGEIAFDEEGNFKVGLKQDDNSWRSLPYAGKAKFVSGTMDERPSVLDGKAYGIGDIFKDSSSKKWYFLVGFDVYGEYIWDEITFGSHDLDTVVESFEAKLSEKADVSDIEDLRIELSDKVSKEDLQDLATKEELIAVGEMTEGVIDSVEDLTRSIDSIENDILEITTRFDNTVSSEDLHSYAETLGAMVDEKTSKKANQTDLQALAELVDEKIDLSVVEDNFVRQVAFNSLFDDTEQLKVTVSEKVDKTHLFDDSGIIRSSLLPGSVDDIVEGWYEDGVFTPYKEPDSEIVPEVAVRGKLYLDISTKILYRWSGTQYVSVSSGNSTLILGTASGTAYEGSSGKALEEAIIALQENVANNSTQITSQNERILANTTEVAKLSINVENQNKSIDDIKTGINSQNTKIDELRKDINANALTLTSHAASINKISQLETKVKAVEDSNTKQQLTIDTNSNTLKTYENVLTDYGNRISYLENNSGSSSNLPSTVNDLSTRVGVLESTVSNQNVTIANLSTLAEGNSANIIQNATRLTALETSNETQKETLRGVVETTSKQGEDISSLYTSIDQHEKRIDKQGNYISTHEKRIDDLEAAVGNISIPELDLSTLIDESGFIKSSLLPGYVDDVIEGVITDDGFAPLLDNYPDGKLPEVAVTGKLYVDVNTKDVYRWSGTQYVKVSSKSLIIGEADGTAYEGSAGKKLEGLVNSHETSISLLKKKVNDLLTMELPDGEVLNFGTLAFKDVITDADITEVSLSKLVLDDELEIYGGSASD